MHNIIIRNKDELKITKTDSELNRIEFIQFFQEMNIVLLEWEKCYGAVRWICTSRPHFSPHPQSSNGGHLGIPEMILSPEINTTFYCN